MSETAKILLVEDDQQLSELICEYLQAKGFEVSTVDNGGEAPQAILSQQPELVILDLMLPGKDGISICREVRSQYPGFILMLTASDESVDQVVGLEIGADDFVNKPVEPRILLARIRALLRRSQKAPVPTVENQRQANERNHLVTGELTIDLDNRDIYFRQKLIETNSQEYDLLVILANRAGQIVTRDEIFLQMKGFAYDGQNRFVDILISQIRHKFPDADRPVVKTIRGKGYLMVK